MGQLHLPQLFSTNLIDILPVGGPAHDAFVWAFVISAIVAYPVYLALIAAKSRQTVSQYAPEGHKKKQGTPTMGGIIVGIGFLVTSFFQFSMVVAGTLTRSICMSVSLLYAGFMLIGFIDDFIVPRYMNGKRGLGWKQKILMQLVVAVGCALMLGGNVSVTMFAVVFLILFFSNAFNFSDGLDGLASLLLLGFAFGLFEVAELKKADVIQSYLRSLAGSILPFLYLNKPRAKVFMGDVGSLPIGAILGLIVSVLAFPDFVPGLYGRVLPDNLANSGASPFTWLALTVASGMMIVELVPVPLQILSVKLRKKRLFSFTPIHHAFERKGWPETKVTVVFAICQLLFCLLAVLIVYYAVANHSPEFTSHSAEPLMWLRLGP